MIFAAFETEGRARAALDRLAGDDFEPGGFSLLARQDLRDRPAGGASEGPKHSPLDELFAAMTRAPDLEVDTHEVAGAGALPNLLKPAPEAGMGGLMRALVEAGVRAEEARTIADTVREWGVVLGVAAENPGRVETAQRILRNEGAKACPAVDVPEGRHDRP